MNFTNTSELGMLDNDTRNVTKVIFSLTACLALIGNILVLLLFFRFPTWLKRAHNQCILSLAVTDILTAISLLVVPKFVQDADSYQVPSNYVARETYCRIVWSHFIPFSLGITSVYTCLVMAIERWFAVLRPLQYKQTFSVRTMRFLIFCSWLAGFAFESPVIPRVVGFEGTQDSAPGCKWTVEASKTKSWTLAIVLFAGQTFIPCSLMVFAYSNIMLRFRSEKEFLVSTRQSLASANSTSSRDLVLRRATAMMAMATLALILCWMPNQIYFLLAQLGYLELKPSIPVRVVGALAFFNCCMNPIIYGFMNEKFRRGYRRLLIPCSEAN